MKTLHRISMVLLAVPLLATLWSSVWEIAYVQTEQVQVADHPGVFFRYDNFVYEAGYAGLAIVVIGLLVLFIPYRRGEAWAFAAMAVLLVCYLLPVFVFLNLPYHLAAWLSPRLPQPRVIGLEAMSFYTYLFTIMELAGLGLALPQFLAGRRNKRT